MSVTEEDWAQNTLDAIVSIKIVNSLEEAIEHINLYSSGHTDAIITESKCSKKIFRKSVNSAIVMHNTSTQFADGGRVWLRCRNWNIYWKTSCKRPSKCSRN